MPVAQAAEMLAFFTGVRISAATVRRTTEGAGAAYEAVQTSAVETLERELPAAPAGPRVQLLSVDGAMVPLQPREWGEVKTLALGTVRLPVQERGEGVVHTEDLSYFSRLTDGETFGRLAVVETHRRGTETARTVGAVTDGAEWIQGVIALHRPDAVRMLDFPQALSDVAQAGQAVYGEGTAACTPWFARQRRTLQHGDPREVVQALPRLAVVAKRRGKSQAVATVQGRLGSLEKRREMLAYAWCHARGYPIGSGRVESANKLVVERRLKGAGMHWARSHVNPMVALRAMACSDRWAEAWPPMAQHVRQQTQQARRQRQLARRQAKASLSVATPLLAQPVILPTAPTAGPQPAWRPPPLPKPPMPKAVKAPSCPPSDHPWRRFPLSWKRAQQTKIAPYAKL
jgi:hypothetical protein